MADGLLNVAKSTLTEFFDDLEGKLAMITGLVDRKAIGLTLKQVRLAMLLIGVPGMGKTCGLISVVEKMNLKLPEEKKLGFKKILLGQTVVGSMQGIPVNMGGRVVRVQIPDLPDEERDGKYGVCFLDEITTADEAQVQPALGLADDSRNIGEYTLPEGWLVVGAGNGPDCSNFLRLDDMTISRFTVYDIAFNFQTDWRPYAQSHGIEDDIIAFLNFSPDTALRVESTDADEAGKLFPCPRTWENLSNEIKIRKALGKAIAPDEISRLAGRVVGASAGREYEAFCRCVEHLAISPEDIVEGEAEDPPADMKREVFFMTLQKCVKLLVDVMDKLGVNEEDMVDWYNDFDDEIITKLANVLRWYLKFQDIDLDATLTAVMQLKQDDKRLSCAMKCKAIGLACPELDAFLSANVELIMENTDILKAF